MNWSKAVSAHVIRIAGWRRMFRAIVLSAMALCAQSGDWAQVQALAPGAQVEIKRFAGGQVAGVVQSVSEDALVLTRKSDSVTVARGDVRRLRLRSDEKSKRGRITGVAILGGIGALGGAVADKQPGGSGRGRAAIFPIFAGVGYLIGWAADGPKRITLYQAPRP